MKIHSTVPSHYMQTDSQTDRAKLLGAFLGLLVMNTPKQGNLILVLKHHAMKRYREVVW
jgi:hypothetical protein